MVAPFYICVYECEPAGGLRRAQAEMAAALVSCAVS